MVWTELHPRTVDELYRILETLAETQAYAFRGHASVAWQHLEPSIRRSLQVKIADEADPMRRRISYVHTEADAIRAFRRHARSLLHYSELTYFDRILDGITLMQHYGAPTRLLDWTLSPWVACYFALQSNHDSDAAIWAFNQSELVRLNRHKNDKGFGRFRKQLIATSVDEWSHEAMTADANVIDRVRYQYANPQMGAQQSLFTVSGQIEVSHDVTLAQNLDSWMTLRIIVRQTWRAALRRRLFWMNISPLALFPSVDGVGRHIREAIESDFALGDEVAFFAQGEGATKVRKDSATGKPRKSRRTRSE